MKDIAGQKLSTSDSPAPTSTGEPAQTPQPPNAANHLAGRPYRFRIWSRNVLAGAVVAASVLTGTLGWHAHSAAAAQRSTAAAVEAAKSKATQLLTYSAPTIDADLVRAKQQVTGEFSKRFHELAATVIEPGARQQALTTKAVVTRAAVISAESDKVVTLLFLSQTTTTAANPQPTQQSSVARVTMSRSNGEWLISDLVPA
jgi:Mce-associated membrane protein